MTITSRQRTFASYSIDVLVYLVVLNLFVEFWDVVVIDSFTISILTAFVLKVLLDLIMAAEHRVSAFFSSREGRRAKLLRVLGVWLILFLSKFVILEVIDFVFGEHVELGSFWTVMVIVIAMMATREVFRRMYVSLGDGQPADDH